jgi:hypothetical protein
MPTPPPSSQPTRRKLPRRFMPYVFAFYMATIMAFLMCAVIVGVQAGIGPGYLASVLKVYALAMPVAFCCVVIVRPFVLRLVALTVHL